LKDNFDELGFNLVLVTCNSDEEGRLRLVLSLSVHRLYDIWSLLCLNRRPKNT